MGIRDRLRKQRQLERQQKLNQMPNDQQTVPEAIEQEKEYTIELKLPCDEKLEDIVEDVVEDVVEEVVEDVVKELKEPMPPVIEPPVVEEKEVEVIEIVINEEEPQPKEESNMLTTGTYTIRGIYKEGLVLSFNNFELRPTTSALIYGNGQRIKGANNPFAILLNQEYILKVTVDPHLLTVQLGKTILKEKMSGSIKLCANQSISIE